MSILLLPLMGGRVRQQKRKGRAVAEDSADGENKTERVQLLMAPSEVTAIDDWGFANRIRTRAEAIRRLCQIGLAFTAEAPGIAKLHEALNDRLDALNAVWAKEPEDSEAWFKEHMDAVDAFVDEAMKLTTAMLVVEMIGEYLASANPKAPERAVEVRQRFAKFRDKLLARANLEGVTLADLKEGLDDE